MQRQEQKKLQEQEQAALEALRRMSDSEREYALSFLLNFAPDRRDAPTLKLVIGGVRGNS
jgi:hypothetical protein